MGVTTDVFDLAGLRLSSGEGRKLELTAKLGDFELSGDTYTVQPSPVPVIIDISRTTGAGYALRLRFEAELNGPCMRCLEPAAQRFSIDVREVSQPAQADEDDELESDYLTDDGQLQVQSWARDALALALPPAILCKPDCLGLCPVCGENLNTAGPEHHHEQGPDPRWDKLSELKFD